LTIAFDLLNWVVIMA